MEFAIVSVIILVFSVILHEVAHGYMADYLGDPTARREGRLTLNPVPHIDMYGSIIIPLSLALMQAPILFGWAKPVPYNPYNIRHKAGEVLVAAAGPLTNLLLALVFGVLIRVGLGEGDALVSSMLYSVVSINVLLTVFNLIPIPPLDGSKIISIFLPRNLKVRYDVLRRTLESQPFVGLALLMVLVLVFGPVLSAITHSVTALIIGL
jgi:Zn-dependent protease